MAIATNSQLPTTEVEDLYYTQPQFRLSDLGVIMRYVRQIDNSPATNIDRSVVIGVVGETTRLTEEFALTETVGLGQTTGRTLLRRVSGVYQDNRDTL